MSRLPLVSPDFGLATLGSAPVVSLHTPAWQCVNTYLLTDPAPKRRNNRPRPGIAGKFGGPGFRDEWSIELEVQILGEYDKDGLPFTDVAEGEETNWRYLVDNIDAQTEDTQGRIAATVTSAIPGMIYLGYVQIDRMRREPIKGTSCCFIEMTLPSGGLVLTEIT